ncbi:hypothetical protein BDR03DRAFT_972332 [Suillus americanus]|nr:hypothetical protein BDR03DRAFT_972332 [Suillus americanus]
MLEVSAIFAPILVRPVATRPYTMRNHSRFNSHLHHLVIGHLVIIKFNGTAENRYDNLFYCRNTMLFDLNRAVISSHTSQEEHPDEQVFEVW